VLRTLDLAARGDHARRCADETELVLSAYGRKPDRYAIARGEGVLWGVTAEEGCTSSDGQ